MTSPSPQKFYWVASDLNSIPPGSVVINPQTGQPFSNPDGSAYRYTPGQPLPQAGPNYAAGQQATVYQLQHQQSSVDWTAQHSQVNLSLVVRKLDWLPSYLHPNISIFYNEYQEK